MLLHQLEKWKNKKQMLDYQIDQDIFASFYEEVTNGSDLFEMITTLAYQIYEMQVCMEGILEDLEVGQKN